MREDPMNILLLEDEKELAEVAKAQIELGGHKVIIAECIAEAHKVLDDKACGIDILIADNQVPDGSGARFAIGAKGKEERIRVIVVSGRLTMNDIEELEAHNIAYFDKPLPYASIVEELIHRHF